MKHEYTDSLELNIFLIYHLLKSIRMNFGEDSALTERHSLALKLTELAIKEYEERAKWLKSLNIPVTSGCDICADCLDKADKLKTLKEEMERFKPFETDGRFFRDGFPHGYIGMLKFFGLKGEKVGMWFIPFKKEENK